MKRPTYLPEPLTFEQAERQRRIHRLCVLAGWLLLVPAVFVLIFLLLH